MSAIVGLKYCASGFEPVVAILKSDKIVFHQDAWTSLCLHETALMRYYKTENPDTGKLKKYIPECATQIQLFGRVG